jgi:hypothetical protein
VKAWSVEQVRDWALSIYGILPEDARALVKQRISGDQLLKVTKEELRSYGVPGGPAGKLMDAIKLLSQPAGGFASRSCVQHAIDCPRSSL